MIDYAVDGNRDLKISSGDFVRVESTYAHQRSLLVDAKGDYKQNPTICVDVESYEDGSDKGAVIRAITTEFMRDGMEVVDLSPNPNATSDSTVRVFNNAFYK